MGRVARQTMEIGECDRALAGGARHVNRGVQGRERDAHVGRMRRDAGLARAENGIDAVDAIDRRAAAAGLAFVTRRRDVIEIETPRALQQVAARRCHVAQLLRCAGQDRARQQRISFLDQRVIGEVAVRYECTDAQAAVRGVLNRLERQTRDVDQPHRALDVIFHQVDEVGAACDELRGRISRDLSHCVRDIGRACILKIDHGLAPIAAMACWIAATMLG